MDYFLTGIVILILWLLWNEMYKPAKGTCESVVSAPSYYTPEVENRTAESDAAIKMMLDGDLANSVYKIPLTDTEYKQSLLKGLYGDVPVYLYNDDDLSYISQWRKPNSGIYIPNSKTYWMNNNRFGEMEYAKKIGMI